MNSRFSWELNRPRNNSGGSLNKCMFQQVGQSNADFNERSEDIKTNNNAFLLGKIPNIKDI